MPAPLPVRPASLIGDLHAFRDTAVILLDGKQTGVKFTAFPNISPPGGGPNPHYHETRRRVALNRRGPR